MANASKKKKEDPALSKEYGRFIYEQALNDADESENEEELLTMDGISFNSASTLCQLD
jgi:hypothetical protein